ncbi:MAG: TnpV protein [Holdemanella porci]|uniref:TnpV protein n=1 Tax=Holdemanella porci TaxID=2652276 RepID=UPI003993982F
MINFHIQIIWQSTRYELVGDYYYPCLTVEKSPPLPKYGRLRQRYLREHEYSAI